MVPAAPAIMLVFKQALGPDRLDTLHTRRFLTQSLSPYVYPSISHHRSSQ